MAGEDLAVKRANWLEHLRAWRQSGLSLAEYVRGHQLRLWEAYEWRRRLRDQGLWIDTRSGPGDRPKVVLHAGQAAVRFARVRVKEPQPRKDLHCAPMLVRVSFGNGRGAELQLLDIAQLAEVFALLERAP